MYKIYPSECQNAANTILKAIEGVCSGKAEHLGQLGGIIAILQDQTAVLSLIYSTWTNAAIMDEPIMEETTQQKGDAQ